MKIVFVCTGNACRSAAAEAVYRTCFDTIERGCKEILYRLDK